MMHITQVSKATLDQLTDELGAACWDSTQTEVRDAREAVVRLLCELNGPYELCDASGDFIRSATTDEVIESVLAGPEGYIEVGGNNCWVM